MRKFTKILVVFLCCWYGLALAADPPPLALMKQVSNNTLSSLQQNKSRLKNRQVVRNIVNKHVVPYFYLPGVSRAVVGRRHWQAASRQTRKDFVKVFKRYVIDMYSSAISSFSDEVIKFKPMRSYSPSQKRVRVYSTVQRPGVPLITLNYRLVKLKSKWKIYDFSIDGISMVQSYRAQFSSVLQQGGLSKLVKQLQARYS